MRYCKGFPVVKEKRTKMQRGGYSCFFNIGTRHEITNKTINVRKPKQSYLVQTQRQEKSPTNTQ